MMKEHIRICRSLDGTHIAAKLLGKGLPLLRASNRLSHLGMECDSPIFAHWIRALSQDQTYIRYDHRGCGLSGRTPPSFAFERWVDDLHAVADMLRLPRFALLGVSHGGATAIAYAARYPERVSHLILLGAYARGRFHRMPALQQREEGQTLLSLIRVGWRHDNPAFRQFFTSRVIPESTPEQQQWLNHFERACAVPENAATILETAFHVDVTALARTLSVPTLVCHALHDAVVPFEEGRFLGATIPSARFLPLDSQNHLLLESEPAWGQFLSALRAFLNSKSPLADAGLTPAEFEVLRLIAQGLNNHAIATALHKSEKTVRNQISAIFSKLGVTTRAQAVVLAIQAGITNRSA